MSLFIKPKDVAAAVNDYEKKKEGLRVKFYGELSYLLEGLDNRLSQIRTAKASLIQEEKEVNTEAEAAAKVLSQLNKGN